MGATDWEQVYVNAAGPFGRPLAQESARQVRDVFARMGMNDLETVVLQGGHAWGKVLFLLLCQLPLNPMFFR